MPTPYSAFSIDLLIDMVRALAKMMPEGAVRDRWTLNVVRAILEKDNGSPDSDVDAIARRASELSHPKGADDAQAHGG